MGKDKKEIRIGGSIRPMASNLAGFVDALQFYKKGTFKRKKIRTKKKVDEWAQNSVYVNTPERKTYFERLKGLLQSHLDLQQNRNYDRESEIVREDFGALISKYGGKYAGLILFHSALKQLGVDSSRLGKLPFIGVDKTVYESLEGMCQKLQLVSTRTDYLKYLSEHKDKFSQGIQDMLRYTEQELSHILEFPYRFNIRTSSSFEYGGPPGFLDSTMAVEGKNRKRDEKAKLLLNFFLSFYNHKFYEGIIPEGVSFSPLVQRALFPDKSAFIFSSLPNASNEGTIIESVLGHAEGIAKGGHSVYTRLNNGSVEEIVNSFNRLPFVFRVNGEDNYEYFPLLGLIQGKDYQKEWEKHHKKRMKVWERATHKIKGGNSPFSLEDLQYLEGIAKGIEDMLGYEVKIEISKLGDTFYPIQLDPLSNVTIDHSYDISVPDGAIVFADTPFVNKPFRSEGRLAYGPYDAIGKLPEEMVFNTRWEDGEGVLRLDPDLLIHYCKNIESVFSARTGSRTYHSAGGLYDFCGFMGSNAGYGPLKYMFNTDKESRITSTPFKVVLVSNGEKGVGYIPKEEMKVYQAEVKKVEEWKAKSK